ncbi:MAG: hypothetical protein WCV80_03155 [Candidatus Paceibacterota bacterium]|jgi:hypothetical protein
MTPEKVKKVLATYREKLEEANIPKKKFVHNGCPESDYEALAHCHAMLDEMDIFIQENRMDKVFRWLGFLQGCFWRIGIYRISEMKNHNRP